MCKNFMVIRHSIKELLAKSMVTRPKKCIVGYTQQKQTYAATNIITTFTYKCTVTRGYDETKDISFEVPSGSMLASLGHLVSSHFRTRSHAEYLLIWLPKGEKAA